jgi:NADH dehydrogenase FAD-containing subunit
MDIYIVGCGFAGLSALKELSKHAKTYSYKIHVIDKRENFIFYPLLPDVIGKNISPDNISYSIKKICDKYNAQFIHDKVISVDTPSKTIITSGNTYKYSYAILCSGAETNFYNNSEIEKHSLKLDDTKDALKILEAVKQNKYKKYVIAGAGYTGIELAFNIKKVLPKREVILIEKDANILGSVPTWMRKYILKQLLKNKIKIKTSITIEHIQDNVLYLSNKETINDAVLIWTSGVKTQKYIDNLNLDGDKYGRVYVDEHLRITPYTYVVGDNSLIPYNGKFLRMGVQFAKSQGLLAAQNIIRTLKGYELFIYVPHDLGYIIPLGNLKSCGEILLDIGIKGAFATFIHYCMCIIRLLGIKNKLIVLKKILF